MEGARLGVTSAGNRKEEEELGEDVTLTETSTFSEITLTDESDTELSPRKVDNKNQTLTIEYYLVKFLSFLTPTCLTVNTLKFKLRDSILLRKSIA